MATQPGMLQGILFDVDGSIMPSDGPFERPILDLFWILLKSSFPMGPVSGRTLEYLKGLALGCGYHFPFMAAESGAVWATLRSASPVVWDVKFACPNELVHLSAFEDTVKFHRRLQICWIDGQQISFNEEPKQGEISIFPKETASLHEWVPAFRKVVSDKKLNLKVTPFPNGSITISPANSNKQHAVDFACQYLSCDPINLLTVVDGINDTELAMDTTCIAVDNANADLKELVYSKHDDGYIAKRHHGYGFVEGLQHFAKLGRLPEGVAAIVEAFTFPE